MNQSHIVGGGIGALTSTTAMDKMTVLLTGFHGLDAAHADAWAWFIVNVATCLMLWWMNKAAAVQPSSAPTATSAPAISQEAAPAVPNA